MIRSLLISTIFMLSSSLFSQDYYTSDYTWSENPLALACPDSLLDEYEVNLKQEIIAEFDYIDEEYIERDLYHRITYLGSDESIENNNRVYLPIANDETLEVSKARAINPNGEIIELSQEDINMAQDEEGNTTYYYAFKGLEIGSIIEYFFIQVIPADYTGARVILQNDITQLNTSFHIVSPLSLVFAYKGFNGFGKMESDTTNSELNHLVKQFNYIPKFKFENQSFYRTNAMQVIYKLDQNIIEHEQNMIRYSDMSEYVLLVSSLGTKKEKKIVKKWLKESGAKKEPSKEQQLRTLEVYIKKNYPILDFSSSELGNLEFVVENKITNPIGFMKSIVYACKELDINYEIAMTSSRANLLVDSSFEAYNYLSTYLMYFPDFGKYIDPSDSYGSLGIISPYYQDNYGVFFNDQSWDMPRAYGSEIKFIKGTKADESHHDMYMDIEMNDDFQNLEVELKTTSTGHFAAGVQPYYDILAPEDIESANEDQVTWIGEGIEVEEVEVLNSGYDQLGVSPFLLHAKFSSAEFVNKVRENYLIKIGMLIGPQTEMYQESKRTMPVNTDFRKNYHRELNFKIPEGYKVNNLKSIIIDNQASDENGVYASFSSSYAIDENVLRISCDEYYERVNYTVEEYEDYRTIINSAADFNKIVLFLEKL